MDQRLTTLETHPKLVLVGGLAGSGKTEASAMLAGLCDWTHLDKDDLTREATEAALIAAGGDPDDRESALYLSRVRPNEYATLIAAGFEILASGRSVVLDAPFMLEVLDRSWLHRVVEHAAGYGAATSVVWVVADLDAMHDRLIARRATRDRYKLEHWAQWSASVSSHPGPVTDVVPVYHLDNRRGQEPYLSNQVISIGHAITGTLRPDAAIPAGGAPPRDRPSSERPGERRRWRR